MSRRDVERAALAWLADDPDPDTRAELASVLGAPPGAERDRALDARFGARLPFGTAGLRGPLGAGPARMNRALVRRAAAGMARWLLGPDAGSAGSGRARERGVAVGFDARHKSVEFAHDTAAVLAAAGIPVHLLPGPLPTPVLAFAVRHLDAAAGVMVTASHNPPGDNGYKVYDGTGVQIVAPTDSAISAAIDDVGPLADVPLAAPDDARIARPGPGIVEAYVAGVLAAVPGPADPTLRVVYTSLHGVGGTVVPELLARAGFGAPAVVAEQIEPDPDFPTVAFPNPEEPGALDLALALAIDAGADVVVANDPDADRLAVAVPATVEAATGGADGAAVAGLPEQSTAPGWRVLRGDEIGVLLGDAALGALHDAPAHEPHSRSGAAGPADRRVPIVATTIVSSQMLGRMAAAAGVDFEATLTGFKWVARAGGTDHRLVFGYEEALGYAWGDLVGDKDGIGALLALLRRLVQLRAEGSSLLGRLDDLARRHGLHETRQRSLRFDGSDGLERISAAMRRLREAPPSELAGRSIARVVDLAVVPNALGLPAADVVILELDGARAVARPSGTEPKLKTYVEVVRDVGVGDGALAEARTAAAADLDALQSALVAALHLD